MTNDIRGKILDFKNLKKGWCFERGVAFQDTTIIGALQIHKWITERDFLDTDAFPGENGEIRITIYYGEDYFELTLNTKGVVKFVKETEGNIIQSSDIPFDQIKDKISAIIPTYC